ncbi:hypothetical protein [Methanobacterium sp.]|uniref:hypothetical protein n=1 Tax=Methanobacterium sp. TaxID=2164 RepID=UPI003C78E81B
MSSKQRHNLIKNLTVKELSEICKSCKLSGYSKYKQKELARFVAENTNIPLKELEGMVNGFIEDRLLTKIKDSEDYFLFKNVIIEHFDEELIKAKAGEFTVTIMNLGTEEFEYYCDEKCNDYRYHVKKGRYPFCKHYMAVIAELIYQNKIDLEKTELKYISGAVLDSLLKTIEKRNKEDGILKSSDREIESTLQKLKDDFLEISKQNSQISRKKYDERPERVFENLVDEAFQLLEFDTIPRRAEFGWDLLIVGTHASPPYLNVIECKTAKNGLYDYLMHNPDYLIRLKSYCIDMCKEKLIGAYKEYVKYMTIVAPDFPKEIIMHSSKFSYMSGGLILSFLPVSTLLYLVEKYRENPILTHDLIEDLFKLPKVIEKSDIDEIFLKAEYQIEEIIFKSKEILRSSMNEFSHNTDSCFIKLDEIMLGKLIDDVLFSLEPHLIKRGIKESMGVKTISIKHDYFKIWNIVLQSLTQEFSKILEEQSLTQEKRTELKEEITKLLQL